MVVGGGAMVAGSFMDGEPGTFFIVGGALVALYGLFYLLFGATTVLDGFPRTR